MILGLILGLFLGLFLGLDFGDHTTAAAPTVVAEPCANAKHPAPNMAFRDRPDFGLDFLLLYAIAVPQRPPNGDGKLAIRSTIDAIWRRRGAGPGVAAVLLMAAGLAGCGSISERTAAAAFTSPGKFDVYTCQDMERAALGLRARQLELEQLMARSSQGTGGEFVNIIAYRGEYAQGRGELVELSKAKADKQCATESQFSSGRAVF